MVDACAGYELSDAHAIAESVSITPYSYHRQSRAYFGNKTKRLTLSYLLFPCESAEE